MNPFVPQFSVIFEGNKNAYGKYVISKDNDYDDHVKVKGFGKTIKEALEISHWNEHLNGESQLGVIPINEESQVKFGAIDIDNYDISHEELNLKIKKNSLPLVCFRSKSGGAHLYLFLKEFVPASLMQKKLRELASFLGQGSAEIFPKQSEIIADRGDVGNWINMPYFNGDDTVQYAISEENAKLSMKEFVSYYEQKVLSETELLKFTIKVTAEFSDGPPCLQQLHDNGLVEGTRNNAMLNYGLYFKKKFPDTWRRKLEEYNASMHNSLPPKEILDIIKSLGNKEYQYACKKEPLCSHCNSKLCRTRKFGIDVGSGFPVMGTLTKLETDPPLWFLDIEDGGRLELTTDDLQSQSRFQRRCMDALNVMPVMPDKNIWQTIVANLLKDTIVIEVPNDSTPKGQLLQHLEDFCTNRPGDDNPEGLLRGLVYNYNMHHHFRLQDFLTYLDRKKFNLFGQNKIISLLREFGCDYKTINIKKGLSRKTYRISFFYKKQIEFEEPEFEGESDIPY